MNGQRDCPECGYAVSELDRTCARCGCDLTGHEAPGDSSVAPGDEGAPGQPGGRSGPKAPKGVPAGGPAASRRSQKSRSPLAWVAAIALLILLVQAAVLHGVWDADTGTSASLVDGLDAETITDGLPDGSNITGSADGSSMPLPDASGIGELFKASPSPQATPTIDMWNQTSDTVINVEFVGPERFEGRIRPKSKLRFQLPRGSYSVRLWAAGVVPRTGRAVFRQHTHYTSRWYVVASPGGYEAPLRMGDIGP
ncbi:MAG: hypothetical protein ACLFWB_01895 [Armatimonadota bacterium]